MSAPTVDDGDVCTPEHCFHAFDALYCELTGSVPVPPLFPDHKFPLFVTWNKVPPGRSPRLRGCIGNFEPLPLHGAIAEYAKISAFEDSRFGPIQEAELHLLECGVSLLTDFEDASFYLDWTIGVHGIYIRFPDPAIYQTSRSSSNTPSPLSSSLFLPRLSSSRRTLTATYLPDVIPEQEWTKTEAVDNAIRKAGWSGPITEDTRRSIKLQRYQSKKSIVRWEDFVRWRSANGDDEISNKSL